MDGNVLRTDVLIVGGGPVGMALGLELRTRGVDFLLLEATELDIDHPRVGTVGPRSMELFRRWGLARRIRDAGWPGDHPLDVAWVTRVGGHEIFRLPFGTSRTRRIPDHTPEPEQVCPQHWLAPLLADELGGKHDAQLRLGWRVQAIKRHDDGVQATVAAAGEVRTVRAKYLVACDGASSPIRKACGVDMPARYPGTVFRNILFRAPLLRKQLGDRAALVHFVNVPGVLRYPLRSMDGDALYRLTASGEDGTAERAPEELVQEAVALETPFEVLSDSPWHLTHRVAENYRAGRVLLAGDAAHTLSPSGGFGMNTGIADAADLGWKLDAVLSGWGGQLLLDSYGAERKPVAEAGLEQSKQNLGRALRRELPPKLADDTAAGEQARQAMTQGLENSGVRREFDAPDIHFGYRYRSGLVLADPAESADESWASAALPGGRAPHAWLSPESSTLDLFGNGFVLLSFESDVNSEHFRRSFAARQVPLSVHEIRSADVARRYGRTHVLVRPDGHVAWRGSGLPEDAAELVDRVRGAADA